MKRFACSGRLGMMFIAGAIAGCSGGGGGSDPADADIRISPISGPVTEAGGEASLSVVLNARPKSDVTIGFASADGGEGTVSPASVTFTRENWDAPQTALVTGVDDAVADGHQTFDVALTITSNDPSYFSLVLEPVRVTNLDDETPGVRVGPIAGATTEGGGQVTIPVVLQSEPTADVVLIFGTSDLTEGVTDVQSFTFTPVNWNAPQNILVTGVNDGVQDGLVNYTILFQNAFSDDPAYANLPVPAIGLGNVDDDSPSIIMTPPTGVTDESGGTVQLSISLSTPPTANVNLSFTTTDTSEVTLSATTRSFTPANWNTAQTIVLTGDDDSIADGDVPYSVSVSTITSVDAGYAAAARPVINLVNLDNDSPGMTVSPLSGVVDETGLLASFTIVLRTQPTGNVRVGLSSSVPDEMQISHDELIFNGTNWDDPVQVYVTGMPDARRDGNQPWFVTFSPAVSSDPNYSGRKPANLAGFTLDTGILRSALVYDDAGGTEADDAALALGWQTTVVATPAALEAAVDSRVHDVVIVESSVDALPLSTEASLSAWTSSGGALVVSHWDLDATDTLEAAVDVTATPYSSHRYLFPQTFGLINMFASAEDLPFPLTGQDVAAENGHELVPGTSGGIAGRLDTLTGPGAIALTRNEGIFVNGFSPDDMIGVDNDGDAIPDMRELYANQLSYLFKQPSAAQFSASGIRALKDGAPNLPTRSTIRVSGVTQTIDKVKVSVTIPHTDNGDIDLFLVGPDGTRVELMTDVSGNRGIGAGCQNDAQRVVFDPSSSSSITTMSSTGVVTGVFRQEAVAPANTLDSYVGKNANGTWTLEAADDAGGDFGTLACWTLIFEF